jgi:hypothetical protein
VSGRIASATSASAQNVTSAPSRPVARRWSVPPYSGRTATTCRRPIIVVCARIAAVIAAMPDPNATAVLVCSSCARAVSNRATVEFHSRAYTAPPSGSGYPPPAMAS